MESQKTWSNGYRHSTSTIYDGNDLALFNDFTRGDDLIGIGTGSNLSRSVCDSPTSSYYDNDLLSSDFDRNDYEWLISPPETPAFASSDDISSHHRRKPSLTRSVSASKLTSSTNIKPNGDRRYKVSHKTSALYTPARTNTHNSRGTLMSPNKFTPSPSFRPQTPRRSVTSNKMQPTMSHQIRLRRMNSMNSTSPVHLSYNRNSVDSPGQGYYCLSPTIQAWQEADPGFSLQTPPNLRTSISRRKPRSPLTVAEHLKSGNKDHSAAHSGFDSLSTSHSQWTSSPSSISSSPTFSPVTPRQLFARPSSTLSRGSTPSPQWELKYLSGSPSSVERNYSPPKKGGLLARMCTSDVVSSTCSTPTRESEMTHSTSIIPRGRSSHVKDLPQTIQGNCTDYPTINASSSNSSTLKDRLPSTSSDIVTSSHKTLANTKSDQDSGPSLNVDSNHIPKPDQLSTSSIFKEQQSSTTCYKQDQIVIPSELDASFDKLQTTMPNQNLCNQQKKGGPEAVPGAPNSVKCHKSENKESTQVDHDVVSDSLTVPDHQNSGDLVKQFNSDAVDSDQLSTVSSNSINDDHIELTNPGSDSGIQPCVSVVDTDVVANAPLENNDKTVSEDHKDAEADEKNEEIGTIQSDSFGYGDCSSMFVLKHRGMQPCSSEKKQEDEKPGECHVNERAISIEAPSHDKNKLIQKEDVDRLLQLMFDDGRESSIQTNTAEHAEMKMEQNQKDQTQSQCQRQAVSKETLSEASTSAIIFCNSIVHEIVYNAMSIASKNEAAAAPKPTRSYNEVKRNLQKRGDCTMLLGRKLFKPHICKNRGSASNRKLEKQDIAMPHNCKNRGSASNKKLEKQGIDLPAIITQKCNLSGCMRTRSKIDRNTCQTKNKCFKWPSTSSNNCQCIVM